MTLVQDRERLYTVEDLALPEFEGFELLDGHPVEKNMGAESSLVGGTLIALLWSFNKKHRLGWVLGSETVYECFPWKNRHGRKPDVSFIKRGALSKVPKGVVHIAPHLAAEVVSPRDTHSEVSAKVEEYLRAGVSLVWVINPDTRTVDIFRNGGETTRLHDTDFLEGDDVLPGFRCSVAELLENPEYED